MSLEGKAIRNDRNADLRFTKGMRAFIHAHTPGKGDVYCLPGDDLIGRVERHRGPRDKSTGYSLVVVEGGTIPNLDGWVARTLDGVVIGWGRTRIKAAEIISNHHHGRGD